MDIQYDEIVRFPFMSHWEIKGIVMYEFPQDLQVKKTYLCQVGYPKNTLEFRCRYGYLTGGECPSQFPLIPEGYTRTFYNSKHLLIAMDMDIHTFNRMLFEHTRNSMFSKLNKAYGEKISPTNFREVGFYGFQNDNHHWRLKAGHEFNYVDPSK